MKNILLKAGELLCIICLAAFIFFVSTQDKVSDTPFEEVSAAVTESCDIDGLIKRDALKLKKVFAFELDAFDSFTYYSSDSVMDVREVLVIKLRDQSQQQSVTDAVSRYVTDKHTLFEGYAPNESELLGSHVLIAKNGYVLFYVGETSELVSSAFQQSL